MEIQYIVSGFRVTLHWQQILKKIFTNSRFEKNRKKTKISMVENNEVRENIYIKIGSG